MPERCPKPAHAPPSVSRLNNSAAAANERDAARENARKAQCTIPPGRAHVSRDEPALEPTACAGEDKKRLGDATAGLEREALVRSRPGALLFQQIDKAAQRRSHLPLFRIAQVKPGIFPRPLFEQRHEHAVFNIRPNRVLGPKRNAQPGDRCPDRGVLIAHDEPPLRFDIDLFLAVLETPLVWMVSPAQRHRKQLCDERSRGVFGRPCRAMYCGEATPICRRLGPSRTVTMSWSMREPSRMPIS